MCEWLEPINAILPKVLELACPESPNFWEEISSRPWADPVPAILFIYLPLWVAIIAITSSGAYGGVSAVKWLWYTISRKRK